MYETLTFKSHLKIEFRAIEDAKDNHILQFRLLPDQDLTYYEEHKFLGLFKWKRKKTYNTDWIQPVYYVNDPISYLYDTFELPRNKRSFVMLNKNEFNWFKENIKTIGEFRAYQENRNNREKEKWEKERERYLEKHGDWY